MKVMKSLFFAAGVMALASCTAQERVSTADEPADPSAIVLENIMTRVSVRQFTAEPIAKTDLQIIMKAGLQAPSAMNKQDWQLRIVSNQEMLNTLTGYMLNTEMGGMMKERMGDKNAFNNAAAVAFIAAETGDDATRWSQIDTALMSENILLAAHALGLGATYQAAPAAMINQSKEAKEYLKTAFGFPENVELVNIIIMGHPAETPAVKDRDQSKGRIIE
ncbi:MAG: nitroreductase family protein [Bacteroidaceae bacterium]|nr:nitroreductase family protein [Bacteroidaceae bacterium]